MDSCKISEDNENCVHTKNIFVIYALSMINY